MDISMKQTGCDYSIYTGANSGSTRAASQAAKINSACKEMESMFIQNMFKEMRASIPKSGLLSGSKAEEMFTDMLDAELAKSISQSGGIGLAPLVQNQLKIIQESAKTNSSQ